MIRRGLVLGPALNSALSGKACSTRSGPNASEAVATTRAADSVGQLCASGVKGPAVCAPANQDPASLWTQALPGGLPVEMWAEWPSTTTLDQLVSSTGALQAWFADTDKALAYVRDTQHHAESYNAIMAVHMTNLLAQARAEQTKLLAQPTIDPIGQFKSALNDKATSGGGSARRPDRFGQAVNQRRKRDLRAGKNGSLADSAAVCGQIAAQYQAYRAGEAAETAGYGALVQQGSAASLVTIATVEQSIVAAARVASTAPNDVELSIMRLEGQTRAFALEFQASLAPYADFMARNNVAIPDMTSGALRSLASMLGYIQSRTELSDSTVNQLLEHVQKLRREALVVIASANATQQTVAQTQLLSASSAFTAKATTCGSEPSGPRPRRARR